MTDEPLFWCRATNKPRNPCAHMQGEFTLRASKARAQERAGNVVIVRRPEPVRSKPEPKPLSAVNVTLNSKCIFFVFLGEMGYEILSSHGWLRKLKYEHPEIIIGVASRAGVAFMYEGACDIYVEIKDVLAKYMSDCFGLELTPEHKEIVLHRCEDAAAARGIGKDKVQIIYSTSAYGGYGIYWGKHYRVASQAYKIYDRFLQQHWSKLILPGYEREREEINHEFPALKLRRYCVLHDRRRGCSWGHEMMVPVETWLEIIDRLKRAGFLVVLIAYGAWKEKDAVSIFSDPRFQDIPGVINLTRFLTDHIERNMLYQALILQGADWQLSPWGTAGKLPCLLGKRSFMLTINRKRYSALKQTADGWNRAFVRCGGHLETLECMPEHASIMHACDAAGLFKPVADTLRSRVTILIPTSWIPSCPGTKLVETVLRSLERIPELHGCRCVIGYDVPPENNAKHRQYATNLAQLNSKLNIEVKQYVNAQQRKCFLSLIRECKTEYFLFWEHDWDWLRLPDLAALVYYMDGQHKMNAVYFSKRDNIDGAKMGDKAEMLRAVPVAEIHHSPVPVLRTNRWSNNPQLCRRSKWDEWFPIVESAPLQWPGQKPSKQIEPALHFKYLDEIARDGFDVAHARWGMYVYGNINNKAMVRHLDGRTFR